MNKNDKKLQKISLEDVKIKELIEQLDKTINPFSKSDLEILNSKENDNEIKLFHKAFKEELEVTIIQGYKTETWTAYEKDGNKIKYTIDYIEQDGKNIQIEHNIHTDKKGKTEEYIKIMCLYEDLKDSRNLSIEYNISKQKIVKKTSSKNTNKNIIIEELQNAIYKAETLTDELITQKGCHVKKYTRS